MDSLLRSPVQAYLALIAAAAVLPAVALELLGDVHGGPTDGTGHLGVMAIVSSMLVERTERGDEMFMTMLRRHSQHVLDTGALVPVVFISDASGLPGRLVIDPPEGLLDLTGEPSDEAVAPDAGDPPDRD